MSNPITIELRIHRNADIPAVLSESMRHVVCGHGNERQMNDRLGWADTLRRIGINLHFSMYDNCKANGEPTTFLLYEWMATKVVITPINEGVLMRLECHDDHSEGSNVVHLWQFLTAALPRVGREAAVTMEDLARKTQPLFSPHC